jgi:hypothetical protein
MFVLPGYCPLNETWFVPGDHWKVPTRIRSQTKAALRIPMCALPICSWMPLSSTVAVVAPLPTFR